MPETNATFSDLLEANDDEAQIDHSTRHREHNDGSSLPTQFGGRATRRTQPRTRNERPKPVPLLGAGDTLGAGDSHLVTDILPQEVADVAFERMKMEVKWHTMYHRGGEVPRLVAVEGEVDEDGR